MDTRTRIVTEGKLQLCNKKSQEMLADYLIDCKARKLSRETIIQYQKDCEQFFIWVYDNLNNIPVTKVVKRDFKIYLLYLLEDRKLSNARCNRILSSIKNFLNFVEDSDEYPEYIKNEIAKIKGFKKEPVREIVFLKDEEILAMYDKLMKEDKPEIALALILGYESAGRKSELAQVRKDSIKENINGTNIVKGKRGKSFRLIYFDLTRKATKRWLEIRKDNNPLLFTTRDGKDIDTSVLYSWIISLQPMYKEMFGEEKNFNVHSLRHSALENYANGSHYVCRERGIQGISLEKLSKISNHANISMTQHYIKDSKIRELEELFDIIIE